MYCKLYYASGNHSFFSSASLFSCIAARIRRISDSRKYRLWMLASCIAKSSLAINRCRRYALEKLQHVEQSHPFSIGRGSFVYCALRICIRNLSASFVKSVPVRANRVGNTQSKRSIPRVTTSNISSISPIPKRCRGLSWGREGIVHYKTWCISLVDFPREPPIA